MLFFLLYIITVLLHYACGGQGDKKLAYNAAE